MITSLIAAFTLGLAGSLHCAGMCGPLVMIVHGGGQLKDSSWWLNKLMYHLGRIIVYSFFGLVAGLIGAGIVSLGFQQWLSLIAGISLLIIILWPYLPIKKMNAGKGLFSFIQHFFNSFIRSTNRSKYFVLGIINGFLPCGLVYAAMAASISAGSTWGSILFMMIFGMATSPILIAIASFSGVIQKKIKSKSLGYVRIGFSLLAILFILRGANLGIPYLSPKLKVETCEVDCCHRP